MPVATHKIISDRRGQGPSWLALPPDAFSPILCHDERLAGLSERCQMHSVYRQKESCFLSGDDKYVAGEEKLNPSP
ncbi:hypothetical protein CesoFtcFv8_005063 [Champsocephalus esox]|uniref:Uncharacterized protein n=1 Tax=Champsocephalus esox TaxID=159716 RepID=A0AAN8CN05_9TELE|nr:hypothetical protein CesoFtcFv8_005063 [Champsocephalus esox]